MGAVTVVLRTYVGETCSTVIAAMPPEKREKSNLKNTAFFATFIVCTISSLSGPSEFCWPPFFATHFHHTSPLLPSLPHPALIHSLSLLRSCCNSGSNPFNRPVPMAWLLHHNLLLPTGGGYHGVVQGEERRCTEEGRSCATQNSPHTSLCIPFNCMRIMGWNIYCVCYHQLFTEVQS